MPNPRDTREGKQGPPGPFPLSFRELLALHMKHMRNKGAIYLFESMHKHKYTDRGIRKMFAQYVAQVRITRSMSPHKMAALSFSPTLGTKVVSL